MGFQYSIVIGVLLLAHHILEISSRIELTNLKCIPRDEKFILFEYCRIKSVNRTYKYFSVHAKLLQGPVSNITVNVATYKRYNGYKPSLYNFTFDACKFLASKNKNILYNYFYGFVSQHSNMNHTCPFDHDLIVDKVTIGFLNHQATAVLPIPKGDYAVFTRWYAYGKLRADVRVYATLS
ncbi:uncharacterized protein Dwil_GK27238 [Drosophila willistoni]|uniref:MD-2-related lipid-recognition domain-containing protein n=1 Tax=Drosophila willistoni TaxID=7260 RepID=A0A0Q9WR49_DROWI|nr:uncharacterized protein Dwil_GK27238 [Drosophila willistoni]